MSHSPKLIEFPDGFPQVGQLVQVYGADKHIDGAVDGVLYGGKFDQKAVAGELDDGAGIIADIRLDHVFPGSLPGGDGAVCIFLHEARIARYVRGKNGRQSALDLPIRHFVSPKAV